MTRILEYWPVLGFIINAVTAWGIWSVRQLTKREIGEAVAQADSAWERRHQNAETHRAEFADDVRDGLADHERRLTVVEEGIKALPTREDIRGIERGIAELARNLSGATATMAAVKESNHATQAAVDRLYRYQLEQTRKGVAE